MTTTSDQPVISDLSGLPHWETIPEDLPGAIAEVKRAIRARIEASGRSVAEVAAEIEDFLRGEIADIEATRTRGEDVWPVIEYADIEAGTVSEQQLAALARRGCAVIRGHFPREQAEAWDRPPSTTSTPTGSSRPTAGRPTTSSPASARR